MDALAQNKTLVVMVVLNALKRLVPGFVHVLLFSFVKYFIFEETICRYYIFIIFRLNSASFNSCFALYHITMPLSPIFDAGYIHMFRADNGVLDDR